MLTWSKSEGWWRSPLPFQPTPAYPCRHGESPHRISRGVCLVDGSITGFFPASAATSSALPTAISTRWCLTRCTATRRRPPAGCSSPTADKHHWLRVPSSCPSLPCPGSQCPTTSFALREQRPTADARGRSAAGCGREAVRVSRHLNPRRSAQMDYLRSTRPRVGSRRVEVHLSGSSASVRHHRATTFHEPRIFSFEHVSILERNWGDVGSLSRRGILARPPTVQGHGAPSLLHELRVPLQREI